MTQQNLWFIYQKVKTNRGVGRVPLDSNQNPAHSMVGIQGQGERSLSKVPPPALQWEELPCKNVWQPWFVACKRNDGQPPATKFLLDFLCITENNYILLSPPPQRRYLPFAQKFPGAAGFYS